MIAASIAIVFRQSDPRSSIGRHLWAGALANLSLAMIEVLIAWYTLTHRREVGILGPGHSVNVVWHADDNS